MYARAVSLPDISRALSQSQSAERAGWLHNCLKKMIDGGYGSEEIPEVIPSGATFEKLRVQRERRGLGEVDAVLFAKAGDRHSVLCALTLIFDMPARIVFRAMNSVNPSLLMVLCRAGNFAWSSVKALFDLNPALDRDGLLEAERCEDYHRISIADCERLVRLVKVHIHQSALIERHKSMSTDMSF